MFKNYTEADQYLGKKTNRPYSHGRATRVVRTDNGVGIRYHETIVVEYTESGVILNSGGWHTLTTRSRINDSLRSLEKLVGFPAYARVVQQDNVWFLYVGNITQYIPFFDGVTIAYDGTITNKPTRKDQTAQLVETRRRLKLIRKYGRDLKTALETGNFKLPGRPGDCWYCHLVNDAGIPLGELSGSNHLLRHIEETYLVPSLIFRLTQQNGSRAAHAGLVAIAQQDINGKAAFAGYAIRDVPRLVVRYLKAKLV